MAPKSLPLRPSVRGCSQWPMCAWKTAKARPSGTRTATFECSVMTASALHIL